MACRESWFQSNVQPGSKTRVAHELAHGRIAHINRRRRIGAVEYVAGDGVMHLRGEQLAQHVALVVDRGGDDVNLAGIVGLIPPRGPFHFLVLLHQVPPDAVQILFRIVV